MTALPISGRSSGNQLKRSTPQSADHARYASPAFTGFQRDKEKQKEQGQKALRGQLAGADVACPLRYKARLVPETTLRVKPVFSPPTCAAAEGHLYTSAEHSVTELYIWSMYTPFSFTCMYTTAHVWGSEDRFVELGLSW